MSNRKESLIISSSSEGIIFRLENNTNRNFFLSVLDDEKVTSPFSLLYENEDKLPA